MNKYQRSGKNVITGTLNRENREEKQVIKKSETKQKVQTDRGNEKKAQGKFLYQVSYQGLNFKTECNKLGF